MRQKNTQETENSNTTCTDFMLDQDGVRKQQRHPTRTNSSIERAQICELQHLD